MIPNQSVVWILGSFHRCQVCVKHPRLPLTGILWYFVINEVGSLRCDGVGVIVCVNIPKLDKLPGDFFPRCARTWPQPWPSPWIAQVCCVSVSLKTLQFLSRCFFLMEEPPQSPDGGHLTLKLDYNMATFEPQGWNETISNVILHLTV